MSRPGEIWLAEIPFTGGAASKTRPVLVLWIDALDAVVAVVTSATPRSPTDVSLADWNSAGLRAIHGALVEIGLFGTDSVAAKTRRFFRERCAENQASLDKPNPLAILISQ